MNPILSYVLVGMSVLELTLGVHVIVRDNRKELYNWLFLFLCCAAAMWGICFTCMGNLQGITIAARFAWRNGIIASILLSNAACVVIVSHLIEMSRLFRRVIYTVLAVCSLAAIPAAMNPDTVEFVETAYGWSYVHHYTESRIIYLFYEVMICILLCVMCLYGFRRGKARRSRFFAVITFAGLVVMMIGGVFDTWLQFRGDPVMPGSVIAVFLVVLIIYYCTVRYAVQRITKQNAEHHLYSIIEEQVFILDEKGKIIQANRSACSYLNVPEKWLVNHPLEEYYAFQTESLQTGSVKGSYCMDAVCKINGATCELRVSHILDPFHETLGDVVAVMDRSEQDRLQRQLRKCEQIAARNSDANSRFIANMSHEMRTPMNVILGMSEMVMKEDLTDSAREAVENVHSAGEDLLDTLNKVLDLSKMEAGRYELVSKPYSLSELVRRAVRMVEGQLADRDVLFFAEVNPAIPDELVGDEKSIQQIMINLLNNAIQFTEHGYVKLYVDGDFRRDDHEGMLMFEISDTGTGIRVEEMERMFEEFTQVDVKTQTSHHRTGLGLTISRHLARLMKGDITASSVYGEGSVFCVHVRQGVRDPRGLADALSECRGRILMAGFSDEFNRFAQLILNDYKIDNEICVTPDEKDLERFRYVAVPEEYFIAHETLLRQNVKDRLVVVRRTELGRSRNEARGTKSVSMPLFGLQMAYLLCHGETMQDNREACRASAEAVAPRDYSGKRILVVDDSIMNLRVTCAMLKHCQAVVDTAISGEDALAMTAERKYDLIFMDHLMPVMDGVETVARMRGQNRIQDTPVIALTANVLAGTRQFFMENGFDDYAMKPLTNAKLNDLLDRYLGDGDNQ